MLFTSYEFFAFITVLFLLYYIVPRRVQWMLLLAAGYVFYAAADPRYLVYILATTVTIYFTARVIERSQEKQAAYLREHKAQMDREEKKAYKEGRHRVRFRWLLLGLLINLGILGTVKYANFFIANINGVMGAFGGTGKLSFVTLALPMGISFYTFQALGYLIDVYRGTVPAEKNFFRLALFVSFFPQLVQGPISRFDDLSKTLYGEHPFDGQTVCFGLQRMLWGYFKKMVIADRILTGLSCIIDAPGQYRGAYAFVGMLFYTVELYADFTGGIDITIGIAQVLGIRLAENFERPYFSKSLKEYWRRWHITMGTWFKDYIFYPISICKPMQKISKFSRSHLGKKIGMRLPVYLSSFVVWFATGFWHGASWNFILWGLFFLVFLVIEKTFLLPYLKKGKVLPHIYVLFFLLISWAIFAVTDLSQLGVLLRKMFSLSAGMDWMYYLRNYAVTFCVAILFSTPLPWKIYCKVKDITAVNLVLMGGVLVMSVAYLVDATYNPFLYFRF